MSDQCPCGAGQISAEIVDLKCRFVCPMCGRRTAWVGDMMKALDAWRRGKTKQQ